MKTFLISKNDAGQRLDKFISKAVPALPKSLMYKYIRTKRIKVNSKKGDIAMKLEQGDKIDMYINDEFFAPADEHYDFLSASSKLDIVYEDENIMLLNKKVGLLSHPDEKEYNDTLITRVKRYLYEKGEYNPKDENSFVPALVNRIDRNTCGIVIAAKNAATLRVLNDKIKDRELEKKYLCVVKGTPKRKSGVLEHFILKNEKTNTVEALAAPAPGAKTAKTKYTVLASHDGMSLGS